MDKVATMPRGDRADLFRETASRTGLPPALIEKDFWVCWTLGKLFTIDSLREVLLFKGGTSLSKVFDLIKRFSEDIDLAVDYAPLGFTGERDPATPMSNSHRQKLLEEMMAACQAFIAGDFIRALDKRFQSVLGKGEPWSLQVRATDPNAVEFHYPPAITESIGSIDPAVLLELGTHAELIPSERYRIKSYAANEFPQLFTEPECKLRAITAQRPLWEKATILHVEHHRPTDKAMPPRHSRHYYDVAMIARTPVKAAALADLELLHRVVEHKKKFYGSAWARYDLAVPATLRLSPRTARVENLRKDYDAMKVMIFGEPPKFDDILTSIREMEAEINAQR